MAPSSLGSLSPSVIGAALRFRRLVFVIVAVCAFIAVAYTFVTGSNYTGKAQVVIEQPPTFLPPFPVSGSHLTAANYISRQLALLESPSLSAQAAGIVNSKVSGAHVTGSQIHSGLTIKPQTGAAAGTNNTTQVLVTLGSAEQAAAGANAVVAAYIDELHAQIKSQANQSIAALTSQIKAVTDELNNVPVPSSSTGFTSSGNGSTTTTTTTVPKPPKTTTTRPPRTTTTRPLRTTTTRPPRTTTTRPTNTTTTDASTTTALGATQPLGPIALTAFRATASTTTTSTTAAANTGSSGSVSSSGSQDARVPLLATLTNLTRSRSQVEVDEATDLSFQPTVFPATIPSTTSNGDYLRNFVIGVLIGLLIGLIAAYAIAARRRQFERPPEPELLYGVPLIAAVPAYNPNGWIPSGLPILTQPAEEPAEQIRVVATALRSIRNSHQSLVIAFSAAGPRSGTTSMVANTGLALASMEERVLVIDGDPIGRGLTRLLTDTNPDHPIVSPRIGFSEVVGGRPLIDSVTTADASPALKVLTAGTDPDLAMHRWSPQSIRLFLQDASEHFDMVLIDVPPLGSSSYGMDLADAVENLIMVIPYLDVIELHERLKERMRVADLTMLGYIFNGAPSMNHFSPYYPMLHDHRELAPVGSTVERALPVASVTKVSNPAGTTVQTGSTPDDLTGVVGSVTASTEPDTSQVEVVDDVTREIPRVDAEPQE